MGCFVHMSHFGIRFASHVYVQMEVTMKVGITVWEDRISPVFDAARMLLVVNIEDHRLVSKQLMPCRPGMIGEFVRILEDEQIEEVICGAISQVPAKTLQAHEIRLVPFIAGTVDSVLHGYVEGDSMEGYRMPGCCGNNRCGRIDWFRNRCCGSSSLDDKTGEPGTEG